MNSFSSFNHTTSKPVQISPEDEELDSQNYIKRYIH